MVPKKVPQIATIVGGAVGGRVALVLVVILCYWVCSRSSQSRVSEDGEAATQENAAPQSPPQRSGSHAVSFYSEGKR